MKPAADSSSRTTSSSTLRIGAGPVGDHRSELGASPARSKPIENLDELRDRDPSFALGRSHRDPKRLRACDRPRNPSSVLAGAVTGTAATSRPVARLEDRRPVDADARYTSVQLAPRIVTSAVAAPRSRRNPHSSIAAEVLSRAPGPHALTAASRPAFDRRVGMPDRPDAPMERCRPPRRRRRAIAGWVRPHASNSAVRNTPQLLGRQLRHLQIARERRLSCALEKKLAPHCPSR